uniref:TGF_BETA_2 domain-containing protein n=1 Tax=Strongyloides venezuelensis TaxID=75913 RepID=A0A0K0EV87_STRVS
MVPNVSKGSYLYRRLTDNLIEELDKKLLVNRLKKKLGLEEDNMEIDVTPFENTIINGRHFGENYHKSEKIKRHFEKTRILLDENDFINDNYGKNKDIVFLAKKSPYERDSDIISHFQFTEKIFHKRFDEGFFVADLKNVHVNKNSKHKYYLQIYKKSYDEDVEDEVILVKFLKRLSDSTNKKLKLYFPKDFIKKMKNEMPLYLNTYAKITLKEINNDSIINIELPSTIKSLHLTLSKNDDKKKRSNYPNCDPIKHGKSCCMVDALINLHSFGELKNIAFPGVINVRRCVGGCTLKDNQSPNSYILDNFSNITTRRKRCCRPTKFETVKFVLKKDNSTAIEISVDDLVVKACECY